MTLEKLLLLLFIAFGISSCSKESVITVDEFPPTIDTTIIDGDQTFRIESVNSAIDSAKVFNQFSLGAQSDSFSVDLFIDGFSNMTIDFSASNFVLGILEEGNQSVTRVLGYSNEYLSALKQWELNGAAPNSKPTFDPIFHKVNYESVNVTLDVSDIELGDEMFQAFLFDTDGNPFIDPITGQAIVFNYKKDVCWIGLDGTVLIPNGESIEISGFFEATYYRII